MKSRSSAWTRWKPLLLKELRETLRDKRTIGTLFLMPLLVYPILSLLMQNFIPKNIGDKQEFGFRILFDSEATFEILKAPLMAADFSLKTEARINSNLDTRKNFASLMDQNPDAVNPSTAVSPSETRPESTDSSALIKPDLVALPASPEDIEFEKHAWNSYQGQAPIEDTVRSGDVDIAIQLVETDEVLPSEQRQTDPLSGKAIQLIYDPNDEYSRRAANFIAVRIERINLIRSNLLNARLNAPKLAMVSRIQTKVTAASSTANSLATFLPLILIMMTITGAVYPAIDLTAGERERGTLESLIAAPISRLGVLTAKYIAVWVVAMLTATLNVASMLTTMWVFQLDKVVLGENGITLWIVIQIFLLLGLYALFFSAILLVVTSVARSFKEAQAYLIPLMVFSLAPGILGLMPNLGSGLWLALVPMVNLVLLARDVMLGNVESVFATLAVVSTLLYAIAALSMAANVFGSDAVLYGSQGNWRDLLRPNRQQVVPSPAFAFNVLAILFPIQFVLLGFMGRLKDTLNPLGMVVTIAIATIGLFLVVPLIAVLLRRYQVVDCFALRAPKWRYLVGGSLLGLSLWPFVGLALWSLGQITAAMGSGTGDGSWTERVLALATSQINDWANIPLWILIPCLAITPAVCEEFFFRGLLLQTVRQRAGFWKAILISGLSFGLFHFIVESSVAPLRFVVTSTLGCVLAWVCLKSNSIVPGVILHSINNAILMSLALLKDKLQQQTELTSPDTFKVVLVLTGFLAVALLGFALIGRSRKESRHLPLGLVTLWMLTLGLSFSAGTGPTTAYALTGATQDSATQDSATQDSAGRVTPDTTVQDENQASVADLPLVAAGWTLKRFADDSLVHDIHCLTVGPSDEVFVAGPGYIAQLVDWDGDGKADQKNAINFEPKQGAQGLLVEQDFIFAVVDQAIWKIDRSTVDPKPAFKFLDLPKTGGEHDFHALRRGQDGYLYFIAGNYSQINETWRSSAVPIGNPRAGVLGRISPDGKTRQILVDGMRNTYDFAFGLDQSFLIYDSDDERDSGMPWYRPTTLFAANEGQDIGWVSRCYKQPDSVVGSATINAETGRGSPTGVACLHSPAWGNAWLGGCVFADWTFGKVYLRSAFETDATVPPMILVQSQNNVAFAPTDLEFDSRGKLYISVGGRDTAGAVYLVQKRAAAPADNAAVNPLTQPDDPFAKLTDLVTQLQHFEAVVPADTANENALGVDTIESTFDYLRNLAQQAKENDLRDQELLGIQLQRSLLRRYLLTTAQPDSQLVTRLLSKAAGSPKQKSLLMANASIWGAMRSWTFQANPVASAASAIHGQILALTMNDDKQLWDQIQTQSGTAQQNPGRPAVSEIDNTTMTATRTQALAALALKNSPLRGGLPTASLLFADLQRIAKKQEPTLAAADWQLVFRWALDSPYPNDAQTGPWDFMAKGYIPGWNPQQTADVNQAFLAAWNACLTKSSSANFKERSAAIFEMESMLRLQLLLGNSASSLPKQWQQWYQLQAFHQADALHPIDQINAFVLLAAIDKPWNEAIDQSCLDFLLSIDQSLAAQNVSIDTNWSQRFSAIGRLLLRNHPTLTLQLKNSNRWQRSTQIHSLQLLTSLDQAAAIKTLSQLWNQWNLVNVDETFLASIVDTRKMWTLNPKALRSLGDLPQLVDQFAADSRQQKANHLAKLLAPGDSTIAALDTNTLLKEVNWTAGNAERGGKLYDSLNCNRCHGKSGRLGPALTGVTRRFNRTDLIETITMPSKNVNDRYRSLLVQKVDGTLLTGIAIYNSTDAVILEDAAGKVWQLSKDEIEDSRPSTQSLMPSGLMDQASNQDWADLLAYLSQQ